MSKEKFLFLSLVLLVFINDLFCVTIFTSEEHIDSDNNRSIIIQMANGFLLSRALTAAAQLGIADQLVLKPKTAIELAKELEVEVNEDSLYRLLRMLAAHGIFKEDKDHNFSLTPLGELLVSDNPKTLRNFLMMDDYSRWAAYGNLDKSIKTGKTAFELTFGQSFFDYISSRPELQEIFDKGMNDISSNENINIVAHINLDNPSDLSIVDVGGGKGGLLIELRKRYPNLGEAILFDYTQLDKKHIIGLEKQNILFKQGSFFEPKDIPENRDIYILKRVLHDWSDEKCILILANCVRAMKAQGKVDNKIIIVDSIISSGNAYHIGKDIDIVMMSLFGGKERTKEEFEKIFNEVGLSLVNITPISGTMLSVMELVKT